MQLAKYPKCDVCKKVLKDWSGNIMIDSKKYHDEIEDFQIWCKECTDKLNSEDVDNLYHNIWELSLVKQGYLEMKLELFGGLKGDKSKWSLEALKKFNQLWCMLYKN